MKRTTGIGLVFVVALVALSVGAPGAAAQTAGHNHIAHVLDSWNDTPEMAGLLPTAISEAQIAARHASLAAADPTSLDAMKRHTAHVLHAVDPTQIENGPGQGYGVKRAAEGAAKHILAAANVDGASGAVKTHAEHVATSLRNTVMRADEIVTLAEKIQMATSTDDAASLTAELDGLTQALLVGVDADGDGSIGWREGGLEVAQTHGNLLKQAEGL